jgi:hypothetical protein
MSFIGMLGIVAPVQSLTQESLLGLSAGRDSRRGRALRRRTVVLLGEEAQLSEEMSHAENRSCDWAGGIAARGGLCDRAGRTLHATAEKRDRPGAQQRYRSSGMATLLD